MWQTIPELGTGLLIASLVGSGYAFSLAVLSAVYPRLVEASRRAAFGTTALCAAAVSILAYAFVTHDFRVGYVARYSDRSMPLGYLVSALWGGQDGSLLWWMFLLAVYSSVCIVWLRGRQPALQPFVVASLMGVVAFLGLVVLIAANPFALSHTGAPIDGQGLNPLLQDLYMIFHPPTLYLGFAGCTIPFAFMIAALVSGRLDQEWIAFARPWMLLAWLFLTLGNALGMVWAYVELGWGGYWAWDPVENASFLPWLTATAFVHSSIVEARRPMFKLWNVGLVSATFFLTIFGTFLTRSGIIASVHAFGESSLGTYFVYFLCFVITLTSALVVWRWKALRPRSHVDTLSSREAAFAASNWIFTGATIFVLVVTILPILSNSVIGRTISAGPEFFNKWVTPMGLAILALMGIAPLLGWRKTNRSAFRHRILFPVCVALIFTTLHAILGNIVRFPSIVKSSVVPAVTICLVAFNIAVLLQEFWRETAARHPKVQTLFEALRLTKISRRKHAGRLVHLGVTTMFLGFLGQAWGESEQKSIEPGQAFTIQNYTLSYQTLRIESDATKDMYFADLIVTNPSGKKLGTVSPAKFVYRTHQDQPTSEASVLHSFRDDLYVVLGSLSPQTGRASLQVFVNPLVSFIWIGVVWLSLGACVLLLPKTTNTRRQPKPSIRDVFTTPRFWKIVAPVATSLGAVACALMVAKVAGASVGFLVLGATFLVSGVWSLWVSLRIVTDDLPAPPATRSQFQEEAEALVRTYLAEYAPQPNPPSSSADTKDAP